MTTFYLDPEGGNDGNDGNDGTTYSAYFEDITVTQA